MTHREPDDRLSPALALGLALFLPAFGTHGLNATVGRTAQALGLSGDDGSWRGLLMAGFPAASLLAYWIAGSLGDRGARRPWILSGIGGYALVHVGLLDPAAVGRAVGRSAAEVFLVLRILAGLCGGAVFVTANALTADLYARQRRGRALSLVWSGIPAALVLGVPVTAYLASFEDAEGWLAQPYALVALPVAVAAFLAVWRLVPEPRRHPVAAPASRSPASRMLRVVPLIAALMPLAVFELLATVSDHTQRAFGWSEVKFGHLFVVLGAAGLVGGLLSSAVADRMGKVRCLVLAQGSFAVLVLALPRVGGALVFTILAGGLSLLSTMRQGPFQALAAGLVPASQRGRLSALILSSGAAGTAAGQYLGQLGMAGAGGFRWVAASSALAMLLALVLSLAFLRERGP